MAAKPPGSSRREQMLNQSPVALQGDPVEVQLQSPQSTQFLAASGSSGPTMDQLGKDCARGARLPSEFFTLEDQAAMKCGDPNDDLSHKLPVLPTQRGNQPATPRRDEV